MTRFCGRSSFGKWIISLLLLAVVFFLFIAKTLVMPRIERIPFHHRFVSSADHFRRLSVVPNCVTIPAPHTGSTFSPGYCTMSLPADWVFTVRQQRRSVAMELPDGAIIAFLPPFRAGLDSRTASLATETEGLWGEVSQMGQTSREHLRPGKGYEIEGDLIRMMWEDPFSWNVQVAHTMPKGVWEVLSMSDAEFRRYQAQAFAKALHRQNDNGIGVFETRHLRGVIRFGRTSSPHEIGAEVFSPQCGIAQGIQVFSASAERSRAVLLAILAGYRYVTDIPSQPSQLESLIGRALQDDARFVPEDE